MKLTIEPTADTYEIDGVFCRRWIGELNGDRVDVLVQSVRPAFGATTEQADRVCETLRAGLPGARPSLFKIADDDDETQHTRRYAQGV